MSVPDATFVDKLIVRVRKKSSVLCVGIDPRFERIPKPLKEEAVRRYGKTWEAMAWLYEAFAGMIMEAVKAHAVAVKPNLAFFLTAGHHGVGAYERLIAHARRCGLLVIGDVKDGESFRDAAEAYAAAHLGRVPFWPGDDGCPRQVPSLLRVDAMTAAVEMGDPWFAMLHEAVIKTGAGVFFLLHPSTHKEGMTSFFQQVTLTREPVWERLALQLRQFTQHTKGTNGWSNIGVVVGATYPKVAERVRDILTQSWILSPGYGNQGATAEMAIAGIGKDGLGVLPTASRSVDYAYDSGPFQCVPEDFMGASERAAREAKNELNEAIERKLAPERS